MIRYYIDNEDIFWRSRETGHIREWSVYYEGWDKWESVTEWYLVRMKLREVKEEELFLEMI
jgi:hypothetical protein